MALAVVGLSVVLVAGLAVADAGRRQPDGAVGTVAPGASTQTGPARPVSGGNPALPAGLRIGQGAAINAVRPAAPVVTGTPLADGVVAKILQRLPAWSGSTDPAGGGFHWPTQSIVKPTTGATIAQSFPAASDGRTPPTAPVPPPAGPLTVLRMQPQGEVAIAPFVSITFDQPMVPVGTVGQLAASAVPATISPAIPGHWDWIGTSTLRFSADSDTVDRLPMATEYTVTVPAGTRSQTGGTLAQAAIATFVTPAPSVQSFTPGSTDPTDLRPVVVAVFDQRVDPAAVLASVTVSAGGAAQPIRAATPAEITADRSATAAYSGAAAGRAVAFVPVGALPAASAVTVTVRAGTPSAEGPRTSTTDARFTFRTRAAMTLVGGGCFGPACEPGSPIQLTFANPIDADAFDPGLVSVSPAIPGGVTISPSGNQIVVAGATQPATTYLVAVAAGLRDIFGQQLAAPGGVSVTFGHAGTQIYPFPTPVTTLDPMVPGSTVAVATVNVTRFRERVFAVDLGNWGAYRDWYAALMQRPEYRPGDDLQVPGWPVLADETVAVSGAADNLTVTTLDLAAQITAQRRQLVVLIEPLDAVPAEQQWQNRPTTSWVQASTLAVDAVAGTTTMRAWVTDLRTGAPIAGATVVRLDQAGNPIDEAGTTDESGLAAMNLGRAATALLATKGGERALLPGEMWGGSWQANPLTDRLLWYLVDDRGTYRPGETVSVKGWVRRQAGTVAAALTTPAAGTVSWSATDGDGTDIGSGSAALDSAGGFDLALPVPAGAHLGGANLHVSLDGAPGSDDLGGDHQFTIADFRTPAFEVEIHSGSTDPAVRGADLQIQADATYYAGGPVGEAPVDWQVRTAQATYSPPGWSTFTFGIWTPWWYGGYGGPYGERGYGPVSEPCCGYGPGGDGAAVVQTFHQQTDGAGSAHLAAQVGNLGQDTDGLPVTVLAQATVTDVTRQQIAGSTALLVHPADYYVGLASDATFVRQGEPLTVQAIVTGIDGAAAAGKTVTVVAGRVAGGWAAEPTDATLVDPQTCTVVSAATPVNCAFTPTVGGQYRITATVADERGRTSRTQLTRWVAGPDGAAATTVQEQSLTLVPDARDYAPGATATLLVASPIATGTGLIILSHQGLVSSRTFPVANGTAVVAIPIDESLIPGVTATVEVVGTAPRPTDPAGAAGVTAARPAYATGRIDLAVSRLSRSLTVVTTPRATTVKPGGQTTIDVTVSDPAGKPVAGSQFEVMVVDEAVLALSGYTLPDPLQAFYPDDRRSGVYGTYGRSTVMLGVPPQVPAAGSAGNAAGAASSAAASAAVPESAPSADTAGGSADGPPKRAPDLQSQNDLASSAPGTPIAQRSAFSALALFRPTVLTGADGTASLPVTLPDNLTRYRIMVVAVAGDTRFGTGESTITAALPLTVRPSPPSFLNFGDTAELPVLVQNTTASALTTDVVLQAAGLTVAGASTGDGPTAGAVGRAVVVPAHGRIEVRFPVTADRAGTARFRVAAVSGDDADAAMQELPVYTPSTSETFATYGTLDPAGGAAGGAAGGTAAVSQKFAVPTGVIPAFGGLRISTASTALAQLSDALDFVTDDQHTSSDALADRITAISSIGDVLQAFSAPERKTPGQLRAQVAADLAALLALQNDDGGFAYWQRGATSDPFVTVQAVRALLVADRAGYAGNSRATAAAAVGKALPYLRDIDAHLPAGTSQQTRDSMQAAALAVRALAGDNATAAADSLAADRGPALPMDAVGWLLPVVSAAQRQPLLTRVRNAAVDDAGSVTFAEAVTDDAWTVLHSDTRTDAVILDALLAVDPHSDMIGKVVAGLLGRQRAGRWDTLQDNTVTLVALRHYYDTFEATTPNFDAAAWLGDTLATSHRFAGHTTEQTAVTIPTAELLARGDTSITLADKGSGRMYYRIALTTAPSSLTVGPLDRGFVVQRRYAGADDAADVTQDAAGVWHVKAGARVRVTVTLVSRSAQNHVALTDPLPAGLESLNPALATIPKDLGPAGDAVPVVGDDARPSAWMPTWFDHQDLRDDRAEAFATYLPGGVYTYTYLALATTPGTFVAPPATAAQIYAPETFGRTGTDHVVVG